MISSVLTVIIIFIFIYMIYNKDRLPKWLTRDHTPENKEHL